MARSVARIAVVLALALGACADKAGPAKVPPADATTPPPDTATPPPDATDRLPDTTQPGADGSTATGGGIWVVDAAGTPVGMLVRRGSDDSVASHDVYDIVTVYHPASGLFFIVTMSDGVVRLPTVTYYRGSNCDEPVGIGIGGCTDCKAGYGIGLLVGGAWYEVTGGSAFEVMGPGSTKQAGLTDQCLAHGTTDAKGFPVTAYTGTTPPPTTFAPPLSFEVR